MQTTRRVTRIAIGVHPSHAFAVRAAAALLLALSFVPVVACAKPQSASPERVLFDAANRERTAMGLPPLRWDESLAAAAREHAQRMAQSNTLSHQFQGEAPLEVRAQQSGARYSVIAENVAQGPSAEAIHSGWMRSAPHRANLLARDLTAVGIAVVTGPGKNMGDILRGGVLFAVEDFSQSVATLSFEQQERQVSALLAQRGLQVNNVNAPGATDDARKTCEASSGFGSSRPSLVVRYEASDLSRLPDDLERKTQGGRYHAAAVGACSPGTGGAFTRFRIAVLFF